MRYDVVGVPLVRATAHAVADLPGWPDLADQRWDVDGARAWLRQVWDRPGVVEAIAHASPVLAWQVESLCGGTVVDAHRARRTVLSVMRYLLRMTGRATPFGFMAGVATASVGAKTAVRWGGGHRVVARADASWLAAVIEELESDPQVLARLPVVANNLCVRRGGWLVVPYQLYGEADSGVRAADVAVRDTPVVRRAVHLARTATRFGVLAGRLVEEFAAAYPRVVQMLTELVRRRVLISCLRAPGSVTDALGYLLGRVDAHDLALCRSVAALVDELRQVRVSLVGRADGPPNGQRAVATAAAVAGQAGRPSSAVNQRVAVDLRLDCAVVVPRRVAAEAAMAASVLARLTAHPFGTPAWQSYHNRFFDRYGIGSLVPVLDVIDPNIGLGFPDGYPGSPPPAASPRSVRDDRLLALAQTAALDGAVEVVVDEALVGELAHPDLGRAQPAPHTELCFSIRAGSAAAIEAGDFTLEVVGVSRGVGTMSGRFAVLLDMPDANPVAATVCAAPTSDPQAMPVQLSYPPLDPRTAHVTRVPDLLPAGIGLGEHHGRHSDRLIGVQDLAVGCDRTRLFLASPRLGRRLEPRILHALDLQAHSPPLARFLTEVARAQTAVLSAFDWGAASSLPFLPRLRYGRVILAPARWLVPARDLPPATAGWPVWEKAWTAWRERRRLPRHVLLGDGDRRLRLDLDEPALLALVRDRLDKAGQITLCEAAGLDELGWFAGRVHEIVLPLAVTQSAPRGPVAEVTATRVLDRDHGRLPGMSRWLFAKLYCHPDRQPEIVAEHLPALLAGWPSAPRWWFMRYRDPRWHLRLRIALAEDDELAFATAARRVSAWVAGLRRQGLAGDLQFATDYPEVGRWGSGPLLEAAEAVFAADSRALQTEFATRPAVPAQALTAANLVAIAVGFTTNPVAGMNWLLQHAPTQPATPVARPVLREAVRLADPTGDWAAVRAVPGGAAIYQAWKERDQALAAYRAELTADHPDAPQPEAVLADLLHAHHIAAHGIDRDDERRCLRLARAAALAWTAHTHRTRP